MITQAPQLETERLSLRGHRLEDFPDCCAMWTDPEVTRFIGGKPSTEQEVWFRLVRYVGALRRRGWVRRLQTGARRGWERR